MSLANDLLKMAAAKPAPKARKKTTSDAKGVYFHSHDRLWHATRYHHGHKHYIGKFATEAEAIEARAAYDQKLAREGYKK